MRFGHSINHRELSTVEDDFTGKFLEFIEAIRSDGSDIEKWEDVVFQRTRPFLNHEVSLKLFTPFDTNHSAKLRFSCYQPKDPYIAKMRGYFMSFYVSCEPSLAPYLKPVKAFFNANDPIQAVALGAKFYESCVTEWVNRAYVKEVDKL